MLAQLLLGMALAGVFAHAVWAVIQGRVFCKGRWYSRGEPAFWPLALTYLFGAPAIGYLAFTATWPGAA